MILTEFPEHPSVATLTIDREERRNALDAATVTALRDRIVELGRDESLRAIVVTGAGSTFSAGADLDALRSLQDGGPDENLADSRLIASLFDAIVRCPIPVVARVNGHAVAGGCGLAAVCDLAYAVDTARFGFTEVRIGFVPAIVSVCLQGRVPGSALRELLLTGRLVDAHEAVRIRLVTRAVAADELDTTVSGAVRSIARATSREAVARTKSLLLATSGLAYPDALRVAIQANADARGTEDCRAGIRAFLERTDPPWHAAWDDAV